jgi:endonuclease/exonuclease/phosphatase family metal-dependent hydrolase
MKNFTRRDFLRTSGGALASVYVLGLAGFGGTPGGSRVQSASAAVLQASEGTTLRIMAWNIAEATIVSKTVTTEQDQTLRKIADQLLAQNPDIVLLNECVEWVLGGNQVADLARMTGLQYWESFRYTNMGPWKWKTVGIISRYPLQDKREHMQPDTDGHAFGTLEATAWVNGVAHPVFSTRIQGGTDNVAGHQHSANLLRGLDPAIPVIFGGDFNSDIMSQQLTDFANNGRLANAAFERLDPEICRDGYYYSFEPAALAPDHIFYRGPYRVAQTKIRCDEPVPSDHAWVLADLSTADNAPLMGHRSLQAWNFPMRYMRTQNSLGELTEISSPLDRRDATFRVVPGLADGRYVSFESASYPNYFLRHQDYRLKLHPRSEESLFKADATFMPIGGLAEDSATSFRSFNYPNRYLRHKDFHLWVEAGADDLFRRDATFKVVPPLIATPIQTLKSATTLGSSAIPVSLSWSATDSDGDVTRYELQRSTDGGAYANVALASPTTTTITQSLSPNHTYRFRVRAQDINGNWSTWRYGQTFKVDARQENGTGVSYPSGWWTQQSLASAYGGTIKYATAGGATAKLTFSGSNVAWVATKGPNRGRAEVWLDGAKVATVDLYSASVQERRVVFASNGLDPMKTHVLEVRVLGTKNTSSSGTRVDLDAFVVLLRSDSAVGDFSATQNPSGVWSYGSRALSGSGFALYTTPSNPWGAGIDRWSPQGATEPIVAYNATGQTASYLTINQPPDMLNVHPGPNGEKSMVRWTAPSSGTVKIEGRFQGIDTHGTTTDVVVVHNSVTPLFSSNINSYGATAPFSITRSVQRGDTIDFSVGYGSNATHSNDSTGLSVTITRE